METQVGCLTQKSSQTIGVKPTVLDIMSRKVVTAYADSNVSNAIKLMVQKNIGSIVIKDNTGPVGIFTERDLIKNVLAKGIAPETQILMEVTPRAFNEIKEDQSLGDAAR
ncbi:MAG: CBS domain-containing protein, partial [Nitrososphaerota archaeon]|nr:CBS domain-containing protein [Nitrososphaerota archaeon]